VTSIADDLIQRGLVRQASGRPSGGGRRGVLLELNPDAGGLLGIDIGASHIMMLLTDMAAHVLAEAEHSWPVARGPEACLANLKAMFDQLMDQSAAAGVQPVAIGVGVPGPVVTSQGMVSAPPSMPGWDGFPIRQRLEDLLGKPVALHNDADLGALGEWSFGAGREARDMVYVKVGTGIGAGLLFGGRIYRGVSGTAGEIGHITIDQNGPRCTCGNRGCLEAMAGGAAIAEQAKLAVRRGEPTVLSSRRPVDDLIARDVAEAVKQGDHLSQQLLRQSGPLIGTAVATLINLFNPSLVVIGGGVAEEGDLLLEPIRQAVRGRSLSASAKAVRIQAAMLGRRSSGMGAVALAQAGALHRLASPAHSLSRSQGGVEEPMTLLETQSV
jgi:glucokinase-like ROK family protein